MQWDDNASVAVEAIENVPFCSPVSEVRLGVPEFSIVGVGGEAMRSPGDNWLLGEELTESIRTEILALSRIRDSLQMNKQMPDPSLVSLSCFISFPGRSKVTSRYGEASNKPGEFSRVLFRSSVPFTRNTKPETLGCQWPN